MWPNPQFPVDLVTFTVEILNGKTSFFVQLTAFSRLLFSQESSKQMFEWILNMLLDWFYRFQKWFHFLQRLLIRIFQEIVTILRCLWWLPPRYTGNFFEIKLLRKIKAWNDTSKVTLSQLKRVSNLKYFKNVSFLLRVSAE